MPPVAVLPVALVDGQPLTALGLGRYLGGVLVLLLAVGAVLHGAVAVRRALGSWSGAPARLVEATVATALVIGVGLLAGGVRVFTGWPVLVAVVVAGLSVGPLVRRLRWRLPPLEPGAAPSDLGSRVVAVAATVLAGAQWVSHTAWGLGHGMTEGDTLWYHGVFAARFVQEGRLDILPDVGASAQGFFPANSQMLHALVFFPFDRDLLSPLVNLGVAALGLLAAYCVGRRRGLGALTLLGGVVLLSVPAIVGTHPGQATNDLLCAVLLLVAVAVLIEGGLEPVPLGLAGAAAAMSLGTKLTVAVPIAALSVVVAVVTLRDRRWRALLAWLVPLGALGAFWFVRNWVRADNPLPWYDVDLGPLHFPRRSVLDDDPSIADFLGTEGVWSAVWYPGLRLAFGRAWWFVAAAPFAAGLAVFGRGRTRAERVAGMTTVVAGIGYLTMPFTMQLEGASFAATARYAAPALLLGLAVLPVALRADRSRALGALLAVGFGVIVFLNAFAPDVDRFAPWRSADVVLAWVLVAVVVALVAALRAIGRGGGRVVVVPLLLVLLVAGFGVQRHYLEHRYAAGAGLRLDRINEWISGAGPERVVVFGSIQFYPFFGPSFANAVHEVLPPAPVADSGDPAVRCRQWQATIRRYRPTLIIDGADFVPVERPDTRWLRANATLTPVARDGRSVLFRVRGRVRLSCPR